MKNTLRFYELYESYSLPTYAKHVRITHIFMVTFYCDTSLFPHIFFMWKPSTTVKKITLKQRSTFLTQAPGLSYINSFNFCSFQNQFILNSSTQKVGRLLYTKGHIYGAFFYINCNSCAINSR